jgi:glutathione S-transferase
MSPATEDDDVAEYTLYCFAQSGNAYKPALALALAGADWIPRWVDYFNGETRTAAYRAINATGEVPVLEHRGERIIQSAVILDYLSSTLGQFGWSSEAERREILRWLFWDNHKLTSYTATYRFLRVLAKNADPAVVAEFRTRAEASWKILDAHLADRAYVVGDRLSIADISMCGYLFFDDEIGVDWITYPGIRAWLERIKAQPGWAHPYTLMPGHPLPAAN